MIIQVFQLYNKLNVRQKIMIIFLREEKLPKDDHQQFNIIHRIFFERRFNFDFD
jgi:hypothetical protein